MKIKHLKFLIVGAFLAFAAGAFFVSGDYKIAAQSRAEAKKKVEILEKVADYKTWKQIVKPAPEKTAETFPVDNSAGYG